MEENPIREEQSEEQPVIGKRVYVYFCLLAVLILTVFGIKSKWQQHVPVKQVIIEGISVIAKDEIVRLMKLPPNVPMYEIDLTAVQKNILSNSFVKSAVLQRDAPSTIRVIIEERKPAAILLAGGMYYVASDGTVLPYVSSSETYDIPFISGADSIAGIAPGKKIVNSDIQEALEIIAASKLTSESVFHSISEIRLRKGKDLVLYSFETGVPIIFGKGDVAKKIVKLDAFMQRFMKNNETTDIQYIDIRFDDQVVVSKKNS